VTLSPAQLAMLIEGIDWRSPERVWQPAKVGQMSANSCTKRGEVASSNQTVQVDSGMRLDLDNLPSDVAWRRNAQH
jgi:hypothetical protein